MIKRSWVQTPAPYTGWMQGMLAITFKKLKIKVAKWGTPKKYLKNKCFNNLKFIVPR
jgi:hypothetical protein